MKSNIKSKDNNSINNKKVASNENLLKLINHLDVVKIKAPRNEKQGLIPSFNTFFNKAKKTKILNIPNIAEGNLNAKFVTPNILKDTIII